MKAMIGIGIFQKPDMLRWMLEGVAENFPRIPMSVIFEADNSEGADARMLREIASDLSLWMTLPVSSDDHILEHGCHRHLIEQFMRSPCDVLIVPQDDNRFQRPLLPDLERLWSQYGTKLGWISGRDGHGFGYADMVCSPFSDSNATKTAIPIGEHREVMMMNTGPVVYFRHVIEKVGMPDPDMAWYWWTDYSLRCHTAGLTNILLSMDCLHEKFGRVGNNPHLFDGELVARNLKTLNDRWAPVLGRNPV